MLYSCTHMATVGIKGLNNIAWYISCRAFQDAGSRIWNANNLSEFVINHSNEPKLVQTGLGIYI